MAEKPTHKPIIRRGRVVGAKPTGTVEAKKLWEVAEPEYRKKFNLSFTAQRKSYWNQSPREGVPSFKSWYKTWLAARKGKKKGQQAAVSGQAKPKE